VIVFDIADKGSFENVRDWLQEVKQYGDKDVVKMLVGNKVDQESRRVVQKDLAQQLADDLDLPYLETSAKNDVNVHEMFAQLATRILKADGGQGGGASGATATPGTITNFKSTQKPKKSGGLCNI
jgi:Ras-related protein Rab-1A